MATSSHEIAPAAAEEVFNPIGCLELAMKLDENPFEYLDKYQREQERRIIADLDRRLSMLLFLVLPDDELKKEQSAETMKAIAAMQEVGEFVARMREGFKR